MPRYVLRAPAIHPADLEQLAVWLTDAGRLFDVKARGNVEQGTITVEWDEGEDFTWSAYASRVTHEPTASELEAGARRAV